MLWKCWSCTSRKILILPIGLSQARNGFEHKMCGFTSSYTCTKSHLGIPGSHLGIPGSHLGIPGSHLGIPGSHLGIPGLCHPYMLKDTFSHGAAELHGRSLFGCQTKLDSLMKFSFLNFSELMHSFENDCVCLLANSGRNTNMLVITART